VFPVEVSSHRLVGQEHELLDQLVGLVGGLLFDPVGPTAFVESYAELGEIQIQGTGRKASFPEGVSEGPSLLKKAIEIIGSRTVEAELRLLVGEAVAGVDDGTVEAGGADAPIGPNPDEGRVGEPLFARTQ